MAASTQWQRARQSVRLYQPIVGPSILDSTTRPLLDWADLGQGMVVLDLAWSTNTAARLAAERVGASGRVIRMEIKAGAIEVGRSPPPASRVPNEQRPGRHFQLSLPDQCVDVAVCAQTLQFLKDRRRALSEIYRILKPDGRVVLSVWREIRENPYFNALVEAMTTHIGSESVAGLRAAFSLSETGAILSLLHEVGFQSISLVVGQLDLDLPDLHEFVPEYLRATPMAAGLEAASSIVQQRVVQEVAERLAPFETPAGARIPFSTHLAVATKSPWPPWQPTRHRPAARHPFLPEVLPGSGLASDRSRVQVRARPQ
jgi:ubiquinone/menaquinone biosynthesis C-methylase UbiE